MKLYWKCPIIFDEMLLISKLINLYIYFNDSLIVISFISLIH